MLQIIQTKQDIKPATILNYICNSIIGLEQEYIHKNKKYLLEQLLKLRQYFIGKEDSMPTQIKKAIAYIDRVLFCKEQNIENRNN